MIGHRLRARDDDRGFALIFTLLVTTMVMAAVTTTLVRTTPNIIASKNSQDISSALLSAESGIQDAVAYLTNVPACRSETRVCPQALGADSAKLNRPVLGTNQTFHWTTNANLTADGLVRVTSVGSQGGVNRTLVADLSLNPSILKYGYYTDYESQTPTFFNNFYNQRTIDLTNSTTYNQISSNNRGSTTVPQTVTWNGAGNNPPGGYSDSVCAQHWYADGSNSPGRAATASAQNSTQSQWAESGSFNGNTIYNVGSCDLVFTAGMTENGPTYTRDAIDIANGNGKGPVFNSPVYTLWGYNGKNNPAAPTTAPWRQSDGAGQDTLPNSPNKPQIAMQDITLPTTIGTDGVETNSCVYYGPTRVVLNGNGTATVTSPATTASALIGSTADAGCYPNNLGSSGITGYTYNYSSVGSGTVYVKNLNTPSTGTWPVTTMKSSTNPAASSEVFWLPVSGSASPDNSSSVNPSAGCSASTAYSAATNAPCAWTGLPNGTAAAASKGWTGYSSTANCNSTSLTASDRQLFECEYGNTTGANRPSSDQYASFRSLVQGYLASGTCGTGTIADQQSCITNGLNGNVLYVANTGKHAYNYSAPANGDHQYYATSTVGTVTNATKSVGSTPANPTAGDSMFTYNGSPGQEQSTATPINVTVYRQTYNSSSRTWGAGVAQFTFTVTHTDWAMTAQPSGVSYFPSAQDVTPYSMGSTASGVAAGTTAPDQPGDLYVEGANQGILSLIAQNNVEITGNITKGSGNDSSAANPVSVTAGNDIRNYHPVSCVDQTSADIAATSPGWCPNDLTGVPTSGTSLNTDGSYTAQHPAAQYTDLPTTSSNAAGVGDRTVDAALFTLTGSLRTDNYDRGVYVGNLIVNGGIYQSHRGANGVTYGNGTNTPGHSGTSLNYNYVDLQRANLQYVPSASYSSNPRVWNVVSISDGS